MGRRKIIPRFTPYFFSCPVAARVPVFAHDAACNILINALAFSIRHKGLHVHAYVFMPDHVHYVLSSDHPRRFSNTIRSLHSYTAHKIVEMLIRRDEGMSLQYFRLKAGRERKGNQHKVWDGDNYPISIQSERMCAAIINYIHKNPVKAGLAERPEDWKYSSARNYVLGDDSILKVDRLF